MAASMGDLAELVRSAITSGDLESYRSLLAPDAHWGSGDAPGQGCRSRNQILAWHRAAFEGGVRATVTEVVTGADHLLIGLEVTGRPAETGAAGPELRWQVLTVRNGLVVDIAGFDNRPDAADRAGV